MIDSNEMCGFINATRNVDFLTYLRSVIDARLTELGHVVRPDPVPAMVRPELSAAVTPDPAEFVAAPLPLPLDVPAESAAAPSPMDIVRPRNGLQFLTPVPPQGDAPTPAEATGPDPAPPAAP